MDLARHNKAIFVAQFSIFIAQFIIHSQHPPKPTSVRFTELFIKQGGSKGALVSPVQQTIVRKFEIFGRLG